MKRPARSPWVTAGAAAAILLSVEFGASISRTGLTAPGVPSPPPSQPRTATPLFGPVIRQLRRRTALRITYNNGYFPPACDFTNGIRFGFALETNDKTNSGEIDIR